MSKINKFIGKAVRINPAKELHVPDCKQYRPSRVLHLARRIAAFSPECEICRSLQVQIDQLCLNISDQLPIPRQSRKDYLYVIKNITRHLKCSHGLVEEKHYVKRYVFIGVTFGILVVLLGLILLSFGITLLALNITVTALVTRTIFGYTIGYFLDRRARKQGRVF